MYHHKPLRDYQINAISNLRDSLRHHRRVCLQLPTGAGKTRIAAEIASLASDKGHGVMFLATRRELIHQAAIAFQKEGLSVGKVMAGERSNTHANIQICSMDTVHARVVRGSGKLVLPAAKLVIADEAHLFITRARQEVLSLWPGAALIGLTATPIRGDGRGLGQVFDDLVLGPSIRELTDQGHLVPVRYFAPSKPDLSKIRLDKDGDYQQKELTKRMNQPKLVGDIIDNWKRLASDRQTVVFCTSIAHSIAVCEAFCAAGIKAEHIDAETPNDHRAAILARVESGATQVVCNVFVMSYGLDIPSLSCAVIARPTKSLGLYMQSVGRILRPFPGKVDAMVIDHSGAVEENGFIDAFIPWSLDGDVKIKDAILKEQQAAKEPAQIECSVCHAVFVARHVCPSCGHEMVRAGKPLPVVQADLEEIKAPKMTAAEKRNATHDWPTKIAFIGGLKTLAAEQGKKDGWVAHKYREFYGCWPNDPRVKNAPMKPPTESALSWIKASRIRYAKSRAAA
jgi:superfamily II DNA or RNA helicase